MFDLQDLQEGVIELFVEAQVPVEADLEIALLMRAANRQAQTAEASKRYCALHRTEVNAYHPRNRVAVKSYYEKNRTVCMQRQNDWRQRNKDRVNARRRELRALKRAR